MKPIRFFLLLAVMLMAPALSSIVWAADAFVVYCDGNKTLYFDYGTVPEAGTTYDGQVVSNVWSGTQVTDSNIDWKVTAAQKRLWTKMSACTQVVFRPGFATVRPANLRAWFYALTNLTSISGLEFLNTSQATDMQYMFAGCSKLTSLDVSGFNTEQVTNMESTFSGCGGIASLDVSGFNTEQVTSMEAMFYGCAGVTSLDVSGFNTNQVTSMNHMFYGCTGLKQLDLQHFNTSKVTEMASMFSGCKGLLSLDLSGFDISNVELIMGMFINCSSLTSLDLSNFGTNQITRTESMFTGCTSLTNIDLRNFDTSKVTNMRNMFNACSALTSLNLSSFNTSNVVYMETMFRFCSSLKTIWVDDDMWNTEKVDDSADMFKGCTSLVGQDGTKVGDVVDKTYAHTGAGGYLTKVGSSTAVKQINKEASSAVPADVYDLQGRRIVKSTRPTMGIVDGRKIRLK